jgi:hypothetical protein
VRPQGANCDIGAFESRPFTLSIFTDGDGGGSVTGTGIDCGSDCDESYPESAVVALTATADTGSIFNGMTGAVCSGTYICEITMFDNQAVTATFTLVPAGDYDLTVNLAGDGDGTVTGTGINCFNGAGADCTETYAGGTVITLTATADTGSTFTGWNGSGCSGTGNCEITMSQSRAVEASFTLIQYELSVSIAGNGSGVVLSDPEGISCTSGGGNCTVLYNYGTNVTLAADAESGSLFTGWSGAGCSGTGDCVVEMTAALSVQATFTEGNYKIYLPVLTKS